MPAAWAARGRRTSVSRATCKLRSVAFPSISTGAYGYPMGQAAEIALGTAMDYLRAHPDIELVRFVLFGASAYRTYEDTLKRLTA